MKRYIALIVASVFLLVELAFAAGTVTVTTYSKSIDGKQLVIKLACTGDASDGSVPATTITDTDLKTVRGYATEGYYLYEVNVVDGATAPDAADIAIADASGVTIYSETGVIPTSGNNEGTLAKFRAVTSALTVTVSNQATVSAVWDIYLTLVK